MDGPLRGYRVLDLGQIYQGPYCGMLLSYLGADVIKIEPPWGENVRTRSEDKKPPQVQYLNPNKRGITLNLKTEGGKRTLKDLVAESDVLIENYASGKMEELGLGYDELQEVNPELVYGHASGYGDDGPYADFPAMDLTVQAMSGVMHTTGFPDTPPVKAGPAICDFLGGVHLVAGILSALLQREQTGEGQYVDVGMFDCMFPTLASPVASLVSEKETPPRTGNRHSGLSISPYNAYEVEDGYVVIICIAERHWEKLAETMGRDDVIGKEKYSSKVQRANNNEEIDAMIEDWLKGKTKDEVVNTLLDRNIPCAPVTSVENLTDDPHLEHRDMINDMINQSETGQDTVPVPGMPIKLSATDSPETEPAPLLGEHTDEVLREFAGYDDEKIASLRDDGAL